MLPVAVSDAIKRLPEFVDLSLLGVLLLSYALYEITEYSMRRRRMPPGPRGIPLVGNRHQMPVVKPWRQFAAWNKQYGPVVSLFLGRTPVIVLGTAQAAWDLLEKRSEIYSSRPRFVVAGEILSDNQRGLMLPVGEGWRKFRRVYHTGFHSRKANTYRDIQSLESKLLMHQLLHEPNDYERHVQRYAASVVVSVSYGKRIDSVDEFIVKENMDSMALSPTFLLPSSPRLTILSIPGKYLVESWPWLLKLPKSMQWFRRIPELRRQREIKFLVGLLDEVRARINDGTCPPCLASVVLAENEKLGLSDIELAYTLSSPFGAGIETTSATIFVFFLAMLHFPEPMRKAQAELDRVVGSDRLPDFQDAESLPYVRALINEVFRWRPVAVLGGTPHASIADDEYNGMFIPKGSTIFANLDGIMRDPATFPDPDAFMPERWLPETRTSTHPRLQLDTFDLPFGFGRRICPGQHLASNSVFINVARILWAFDILPKEGAPLPDVWAFSDGFNSWPERFECKIEVRSERARECIEREWETAKEALGKWQ
ncbi:cytochrome P450 [Dentipellis sp. KUC8613]|nr:cytochrome P450 [Dentipellis sp. KUC8613]